MCGITGLVNLDRAPLDRAELSAMTDALAHRGPDDAGYHISGAMGLGHRRLSIIDLESGHQPIPNEDESMWLVCNGEIYNYRELRDLLISKEHRFRTHSDSEVILHGYEEWGRDVVCRLRGMFAFAIWSERDQELFLARDRVGIKPLVYYHSGSRFAFASEIQALRRTAAFDAEVDLQALDLYLHYLYIPGPYTIYKSVRKLLPAHTMTISAAGEIRTEGPYWEFRFEAGQERTESEWVERLDHALEDAVRSHLVSDVPFGSFLSGGVDSSAVTAYMSRNLEAPVRAFSVGFDEAEHDETEYARVAAESVGAELHMTRVRPHALEILPDLARHYGEPFGDSSAVCTYYVAQAARAQVKMVLSGDGGDESHGGYEYFAKMASRYRAPSGPLELARRRVGACLRALGIRQPAPSLEDAWYDRYPYFGEGMRQELWRPEHQWVVSNSRQWNRAQFDAVRGQATLDQCQSVDIRNYLVYDNLSKVDIASMAHGLEVRVPLLDHKLLEVVGQIPRHLRVSSGVETGGPATPQGKVLLRHATQRFFPDGFYDRRKMGFSIPVSDWMTETGRGNLSDRLLSGSGRLGDWFDPQIISGIIDRHIDGRDDHGHRLWALLFLAAWDTNDRDRSAGAERRT
ncbi:MAG: asparagine synthase (glutamine-hydrolyzing) [Verrucomicrobia bacterium]|nr:asparagine synthase (glutamine-hydrolyzing) [Verrucomicrobiota bacterium]MDA1088066.1 asparagine synthase (glutamine-hydrolyzing) [Verrucomicrobiota bacterium]